MEHKVISKTTGSKILCIFLVLLYAVIIAAAIIAGLDAEVANAATKIHLVLVSTLLGIHLAGMIKDTASLPKGDFKSLYTPYVICAVASFLLILIASFLHPSTALNPSLTDAIVGIGVVLIMVVGSINGNGLVTGNGAIESTSYPVNAIEDTIAPENTR